jgi:hypothetical protein
MNSRGDETLPGPATTNLRQPLATGTPEQPKAQRSDTSLRLLGAAAVSVLSLLLARLAFVPLYQSNDDVTMRLTAEGVAIATRPTPYLLFINAILGELMVWLHNLVPSISWFTASLALIQLMGTATVMWVALGSGAGSRIQALIFLSCFDFWFWVYPRFTMTAAVAAIGAIVLWLDQLARYGRLKGVPLAWFVALVVCSSLVRWQSGALLFAAGLPAVAWESWRRWHSARELARFRLREVPPSPRPLTPKRGERGVECESPELGETGKREASPVKALVTALLTPALVACLAAGSVKTANDWIYHTSPGWEHFQEFNEVRAEFLDYERAPFDRSTLATFQSLGLTPNDYHMLRSWAFEDPERFSIDVLRKLNKALPPAPPSSHWQTLRDRYGEITGDPWTQLIIVAMLLSPVLAGGEGRLRMAITLLSVICASLVIVWVFQRFPTSVSHPLAALVPAIGAVGKGSSRPFSIARKIAYAIGLGILSVLLVRLWMATTLRADAIQAMSNRLVEAVKELRPQPDQLYVDWGGNFPYELLLGARQIRALEPMRMLSLGCANQTPINRERLQQFHIENIFRAICERPNTRVIGQWTTVAQMQGYAQEHCGRRLRVREVMHRRLGGYPKIDGATGEVVPYVKDLIVYQFEDAGPVFDRPRR